MANNEMVGKRIQHIRLSHGNTLEEFGKLVENASKGMVSNWERGINLPNKARLARIAEIGSITVDELLYGTSAEHLEIAEKAYEIALNSTPNDSKEGAALRYFNLSQRKILFTDTLNTYFDSMAYNPDSGIEVEMLASFMIVVFFKKYANKIKTNSNLVETIFHDLLEINVHDYPSLGRERFESPDGAYTFFVTEMSGDVNQELIKKIHDKIVDTLLELHKLKKQYPDKPGSNFKEIYAVDNQNMQTRQSPINLGTDKDGVISSIESLWPEKISEDLRNKLLQYYQDWKKSNK